MKIIVMLVSLFFVANVYSQNCSEENFKKGLKVTNEAIVYINLCTKAERCEKFLKFIMDDKAAVIKSLKGCISNNPTGVEKKFLERSIELLIVLKELE